MKNKEGARATRPGSRQSAAKKPAVTASFTIEQLQTENAALVARLAVAEVEIAKLERQRDEALNRIDWVIDSINSLAESIR